MKLDKTFGATLKRKRNESGLSLREVADRTGLGFSHVYRLEQGERTNIRLRTLRALESVFGLLTEEIPERVTGDGEDAWELLLCSGLTRRQMELACVARAQSYLQGINDKRDWQIQAKGGKHEIQNQGVHKLPGGRG